MQSEHQREPVLRHAGGAAQESAAEHQEPQQQEIAARVRLADTCLLMTLRLLSEHLLTQGVVEPPRTLARHTLGDDRGADVIRAKSECSCSNRSFRC